eukprot:540574-Pyramimonas_sp.AAC.1
MLSNQLRRQLPARGLPPARVCPTDLLLCAMIGVSRYRVGFGLTQTPLWLLPAASPHLHIPRL